MSSWRPVTVPSGRAPVPIVDRNPRCTECRVGLGDYFTRPWKLACWVCKTVNDSPRAAGRERVMADDESPPPAVGKAEPASGDDDDYPAAHLYLPDAATKSGWYIRDVKRRKDNEPRRRAGFVP